jgi:hypothetical protein
MIITALSNSLSYVDGECESKVLTFEAESNQFGFEYGIFELPQQARAFLYLMSPKPVIKETVYRKTNGERRAGNVYIDKSYRGVTDQVDESTMDAISVALKHQSLSIDGVSYFCEGDIEPTDNDFDNRQSLEFTLYKQEGNVDNISC